MIAPGRVMLALLAAGQSRRFGDADKLSADVAGMPLALHAVAALRPIAFLNRVAIISGTSVDFTAHGYRLIANPAPEAGLSGSVRLAADAAQQMGATAVIMALADMPCITTAQVERLLSQAARPDDVIASTDGMRPSPPALFGAGQFAALGSLTGDEGARTLLRHARQIAAEPGTLIDVDTPADLEVADQRLRAIRGAARQSG